MSPQYDFFIAGRTRNRANIIPVVDAVRSAGKTAYCFIENEYEAEKVQFTADIDPEKAISRLENLTQSDELITKIFTNDMKAERNSEHFLLVLPAGTSGHIEAGVAYGLGKKCYAIGKQEKTETLYCIFDRIFVDVEELTEWLKSR